VSPTVWEKGDRVQHIAKYGRKVVRSLGTVDKYIAQNGKYRAMVVVEWDDDSRGTIGADDVVPEEIK